MDGPIISAVRKMNLSKTKVLIGWVTDIPANSRVDYGTTTSYGSNVTDSSYLNRHGLWLTGLTANTTYHFKVTSVDQLGNSVASADYTFTTKNTTYLPGDIDSSGVVNAADLSIITQNLGTANKTYAQGCADGNVSGAVDQSAKALLTYHV